MASRSPLILRLRDPLDQWIESQGFYRKLIAKDGSCLFRAVAEQVFHTQVLHTQVRLACVRFMQRHEDLFSKQGDGSVSEHVSSMRNPWEWGGEFEMKVMSVMYRRDFLVYRELGAQPVEITNNGFKDKVILCQIGTCQYDSVYAKEYVKDAAFCQAIVYHMLYDQVFQMKGTDYAVEKMLHDKTVRLRRDSCMAHCSTCTTVRKHNMHNMNGHMNVFCNGKILDASLEENMMFEEWFSNAKEILIQGIIPFPYKVAKALDSEIYRNIEFDVWNEQRKELRWGVNNGLGDNGELRVGSKCLVRMESSPGKDFHAHIQEMALEKGPVLVYVEELAQKCIVQFETLEPLPRTIPTQPLKYEKGKPLWKNNAKRIAANTCVQNNVNEAHSSRTYGFQTWRSSASFKNNKYSGQGQKIQGVNCGRYDNRGHSGSGKDGGGQKNVGNRIRGRASQAQAPVLPPVPSSMARSGCQTLPLNTEERYTQVLFSGQQIPLNMQTQSPENSVSLAQQVTSVLESNANVLPNGTKQSPTPSNCTTSSGENLATGCPLPVIPCDCLQCIVRLDSQMGPINQPMDFDRQSWGPQPLCYCCSYQYVDWRPGPNGGNQIPSYACNGGPLPLIQPPMFPCTTMPPGMCLTAPESMMTEGRNLPFTDAPGYRFFNVGHDYFRSGFVAWPGSGAYVAQPTEAEVTRTEDEETTQPPTVVLDTIQPPNVCSTPSPPLLSTTANQDQTITRQIGQQDQVAEFPSHVEEGKTNFDGNPGHLKYSSNSPVRVTGDHGVLSAGERGREETPLNADFPADQESESVQQSQVVERWAEMIRQVPPPPIIPPCMPIPAQPRMVPYPPPHGGLEPQFCLCTTTTTAAGPHSQGHHVMFTPFPQPHSLPRPPPHLLAPPGMHTRFVYPTVSGGMQTNPAPH